MTKYFGKDEFCSYGQRILYKAIISLFIFCLRSPFAAGAANQTASMMDIMLYMNSHKDLPEYCQCRLAESQFRDTFRNAQQPSRVDWPVAFANLRAKWIKIIGENNWVHFHHYCLGAMRLNQAIGMTGGSEQEQRRIKATLDWALQEFQYIQSAITDSSFPLWPQLYVYEFQIYSRLGQPVKAQWSLQRAAELHKKKSKSPP